MSRGQITRLPLRLSYAQAMKEAKADYLAMALAAAQGNVSLAANLAGINRTQMHKMLAQTAVKLPDAERRAKIIRGIIEARSVCK